MRRSRSGSRKGNETFVNELPQSAKFRKADAKQAHPVYVRARSRSASRGRQNDENFTDFSSSDKNSPVRPMSMTQIGLKSKRQREDRPMMPQARVMYKMR